MQINTRQRRLSPTTIVGTLLIALAVFGWGLQYKLSLYQAEGSPSRLVPHAKLLSQKERVTAPSAVAVDGRASMQPLSSADYPVLLLAIVVFGLYLQPLAQARQTATAIDARQRSMAETTFFSFRPPPTLA